MARSVYRSHLLASGIYDLPKTVVDYDYPKERKSFVPPIKRDPIEVVAFTKPAAYENLAGNKLALPYQRIVALWHNDGFFGEHVGKKGTSELTERGLQLSFEMGQRLLQGLRTIEARESVNCHYFGRLMAGLELNHDAPYLASEGRRVDTPLPLGQLGIVASLDEYPDHSLIGLGEDVDESLQVISGFGELGIAKNADVLTFYRDLKQNPDKSIFVASS